MATKLVSVEDFAVRAGLGNVDDLAEDVTAKAQASIEAATLYIQTILRTEFDEATLADQYYVDTGEFPFVGEFPRLYLTQGFVSTPVASLTVRSADLLPDLAAATAMATDYLVLDANKGTVLITGTDQLPIGALAPITGDRFFLRIEYTAGFQSEADSYGSIYVDAPEYLREAAIVLAKSIFDMGQPCEPKDVNDKGCPCSVEKFLNRYIRFLPSALKPLN